MRQIILHSETFHEVDGKYTPDWQFIAQAEVIKKSELIFESLGGPLV